jgi:hypothetical protein
MGLNKDQVRIMRHCIGWHDAAIEPRNRYITDPRGDDGKVCRALAARGYMRMHGDTCSREMFGNMWKFEVTPEGIAALSRLLS